MAQAEKDPLGKISGTVAYAYRIIADHYWGNRLVRYANTHGD